MLRPLVNLLLYGHFWIATAALAMTVQTHLLLQSTWHWGALDGFIASGTLTIYALHRMVALRIAGGHPQEGRFEIMQTFRWHIIAYAALSAIIAAYFYWQLPAFLKLSLLVPNLIALGYVLPLLNGRRLRDLPYLKIFLIALSWAWITVIAPAQSAGLAIDGSILMMTIERACFIFAITIPFDIRDMAQDQQAAVNTLPGQWGILRAKKIALASLVLMVILVLLNYWLGQYPFGVCLGLFLSAISSAILIWKATPEKHDYYFTGLLDGTMIIQFGLVWFLG
jgi:4-hydroxybenzoate polyprenyltransferase